MDKELKKLIQEKKLSDNDIINLIKKSYENNDTEEEEDESDDSADSEEQNNAESNAAKKSNGNKLTMDDLKKLIKDEIMAAQKGKNTKPIGKPKVDSNFIEIEGFGVIPK